MDYYTHGRKQSLAALGLYKQAEWEGQDYATAAGTAALAAPLLYKGLRRFKPSDNATLRNLQEAAKDSTFEVATHAPTGSRVGRGIRRILYGAPDISDDVRNAGRQGQVLKRDTTVLHHGSPFSQLPVEGKVNLNAPRDNLSDALADKGTFADIFKQVQTQLGDDITAIPATESMRDVLPAFQGDVSKMQKHLKENLPDGFLVKPTDESLGDVSSFISDATPGTDPRYARVHRSPGDFVLQEKIPIDKEYRVHTVQGQPFYSTHRRLPEGKLRDAWNAVSKRMGIGEGGFAQMPVSGAERKALEEYVAKVNAPLSDAYGRAPMHQAFDVARLPDGTFRLIESNPTPGTFNNPVISRKLQEQVTGRMHGDKAKLLAALGAGTAGAGAGVASDALRD